MLVILSMRIYFSYFITIIILQESMNRTEIQYPNINKLSVKFVLDISHNDPVLTFIVDLGVVLHNAVHFLIKIQLQFYWFDEDGKYWLLHYLLWVFQILCYWNQFFDIALVFLQEKAPVDQLDQTVFQSPSWSCLVSFVFVNLLNGRNINRISSGLELSYLWMEHQFIVT